MFGYVLMPVISCIICIGYGDAFVMAAQAVATAGTGFILIV